MIDYVSVSGRTAISRTRVSAPLQWLLDHDLIVGDSCNWGEGKAFLDTDAMEERTGFAIGYDPNSTRPWNRMVFPSEMFTTIYCGYVLNTLDARTASNTIEDIRAHLQPGGIAYFAVRTDKVEGLPWYDGVLTQKGTFQMSYRALTKVSCTYDWIHKASHYAIFRIEG